MFYSKNHHPGLLKPGASAHPIRQRSILGNVVVSSELAPTQTTLVYTQVGCLDTCEIVFNIIIGYLDVILLVLGLNCSKDG